MKEGTPGHYGGEDNVDFLNGIENQMKDAENASLNAVNLDEAIPPAGIDEARDYAKKLFNAADSPERRVAVLIWAFKGIDKWSTMDLSDGLRHFCLWALPQLTGVENKMVDEYRSQEDKEFKELLSNPEIFEQPDENPDDEDKPY